MVNGAFSFVNIRAQESTTVQIATLCDAVPESMGITSERSIDTLLSKVRIFK